MILKSNPPVVIGDPSAELLRQQLKRSVHWDCPVLKSDPGPEQQPPGMLWIRSDLRGCERYRFYDENGRVVTLCGDGGDADDGSGSGTTTLAIELPGETDVIENTSARTAFATSYAVPGGTIQAGDVYRIKVYGNTSTATVSAGSLTVWLGFGQVLLYVTNINLTLNMDNEPWLFFADIGIESLGEAEDETNTRHYGFFSINFTSSQNFNRPAASSGNSIDVGDPATDKNITVEAQFTTANPDHKIWLRMLTVERLRV